MLSRHNRKTPGGAIPSAYRQGCSSLWNRANEAERITLLRQPSGPSGSSVSEDFARRKAAEWKTWADIPEGPAKSRREALKNREQKTPAQSRLMAVIPRKKEAKGGFRLM